ncbi:hypothetical protein KGQ27_03090 [Patescibacteria group bacterium]|nr:hypothetical protein [Patescibacteria group bacterium]MDE2233558.1 hypothetical protein [Patescibacteria group bacterium]
MQPALEIPYIDFGSFFKSIGSATVDFYPHLIQGIKDVAGILIGISIPLSLFFLIVIIYSTEQLKRIRKKEAEAFDLKVVPAYEKTEGGDPETAKRWRDIVEHISSNNSNDWRQALIDADIILDQTLTKMGYQGQTVGDKLQRVAKGDFNTIDDAWKAHKVRNQIAHEGSGFELNHHEAKKAFDAYRRVFEEFYYI